ncbi:Hypothetical protein A7982_09374 [Minicystis rosea]|nr:Hypothetical protein A7982_09374 [Minicystis rosea]
MGEPIGSRGSGTTLARVARGPSTGADHASAAHSTGRPQLPEEGIIPMLRELSPTSPNQRKVL